LRNRVFKRLEGYARLSEAKGDDILSHITAVLPKRRDAGGLNFSVRTRFYLIFSKKKILIN
jgi:hypothetical protein